MSWGGAFNDMGPYASTIGLKFWENNAENIYIDKKIENGLISSSVIADYGEGKNLVGKFFLMILTTITLHLNQR